MLFPLESSLRISACIKRTIESGKCGKLVSKAYPNTLQGSATRSQDLGSFHLYVFPFNAHSLEVSLDSTKKRFGVIHPFHGNQKDVRFENRDRGQQLF